MLFKIRFLYSVQKSLGHGFPKAAMNEIHKLYQQFFCSSKTVYQLGPMVLIGSIDDFHCTRN